MTERKPLSDWEEEIVTLLGADDERAIELVLKQLGPRIMTLLRSRFHSVLQPNDLEDILSRALYRLWLNRKVFDPGKGPLAAWFYVLARNDAVDVLREKTRQDRLTAAPHGGASSLEGTEGLGGTDDEQALWGAWPPDLMRLRQELREALSELSDRERRIIEADLAATNRVASTNELASQLGLSVGAVRVYRHRALEKLRNQLRSRGYETIRSGERS